MGSVSESGNAAWVGSCIHAGLHSQLMSMVREEDAMEELGRHGLQRAQADVDGGHGARVEGAMDEGILSAGGGEMPSKTGCGGGVNGCM